jgi:hypothetical protein
MPGKPADLMPSRHDDERSDDVIDRRAEQLPLPAGRSGSRIAFGSV